MTYGLCTLVDEGPELTRGGTGWEQERCRSLPKGVGGLMQTEGCYVRVP